MNLAAGRASKQPARKAAKQTRNSNEPAIDDGKQKYDPKKSLRENLLARVKEIGG